MRKLFSRLGQASLSAFFCQLVSTGPGVTGQLPTSESPRQLPLDLLARHWTVVPVGIAQIALSSSLQRTRTAYSFHLKLIPPIMITPSSPLFPSTNPIIRAIPPSSAPEYGRACYIWGSCAPDARRQRPGRPMEIETRGFRTTWPSLTRRSDSEAEQAASESQARAAAHPTPAGSVVSRLNVAAAPAATPAPAAGVCGARVVAWWRPRRGGESRLALASYHQHTWVYPDLPQ
jgi:hypothetical protein